MTTALSEQPTRKLRLPSFGIQVLIGLVLGVVLGLVARAIGPDGAGDPNWLTETLSTVGGVFVTLLRTIVPPLVFLAIVASIANLRDVTGAARLAWKTLAWFAITALIAVVDRHRARAACSSPVTTPPSRPTPPPRRGDHRFVARLPHRPRAGQRPRPGGQRRRRRLGRPRRSTCCRSWSSRSRSASPRSRSARPPTRSWPFVRSALAVVQKVLWWVIRLAPIGTIGLLGTAVATYGWDALGSLGTFTVAIYIGLALVLFGVYPILLRLNGLSVKQFFSGAWPAIPLGVRLALVDRHPAGHRSGHRAQPRRASRVRLVRRAARRDHQDGRLRGDLPGDLGDLRRPVLRRSTCRSPTTC